MPADPQDQARRLRAACKVRRDEFGRDVCAYIDACTVLAIADELSASSPSETTSDTCIDCKSPLDPGEAKIFTVCDACWNARYRPYFPAR